jgi:NAD(P)-dependent dehydrogenase (short-subunit alcohol dehydrogenase family)
LRKQRHGKIITLGSMLGLLGLPGVAYYAASKHALEGYFKSLRFELAQFNIKVSMVEPMSFKTGIGTNAVAASKAIGDYDRFRHKVDVYRQGTFDKAPAPEPVLRTVLRILQEKEPEFSYPVGRGTAFILALQKFAYRAFERSILKRVEAAA